MSSPHPGHVTQTLTSEYVQATAEAVNEERVYAKVTRRLIPFFFLFYVGDYLDRVNIGFAKLEMMKYLGWSDTIYGIGAGVFFIGYFLFEVPSNIILYKFGARQWIATIMLIWGVVSACTMFVASPFWLYILRFGLGLAEAGFFPGVVLYLTYWYPKRRRGKVVAIFMAATSVAGLVGGPVSGWIMHSMQGIAGLRGWQWLFILEGIPSVLMSGLVLTVLDNSIQEAKWLGDDEKLLLEKNIAEDFSPTQHTSLSQVLVDSRVWLCSFVLFLLLFGFYGIAFFLPQFIHDTGVKSVLTVSLLTAIPFAAATVSMVWLGHRSDRMGERHAHIAISAFVGAATLVISGLVGGNALYSVVALTLATAATYATIPVMCALPTEILSGIAAAGGIGIIYSIGNLAGFFAPTALGRIKDATHRSDLGLYLLAASMLLAGIILMVMRAAARKQAVQSAAAA